MNAAGNAAGAVWSGRQRIPGQGLRKRLWMYIADCIMGVYDEMAEDIRFGQTTG